MLSRLLTLGAFVLFLAAELPLFAQYPPGGYPPGGYPPGAYPPGSTRLEVPASPCRAAARKRPPRKKRTRRPTRHEGHAPQAGRQVGGGRAAGYAHRQSEAHGHGPNSSRTGEEIKPDTLKPGDHLEIEYREDDQGYLFAVNVMLEKEGTDDERAKASEPVEMISAQGQNKTTSDDERPVQRRKDSTAPAEADKEDDDEPKDVRRSGQDPIRLRKARRRHRRRRSFRPWLLPKRGSIWITFPHPPVRKSPPMTTITRRLV